MHHAKPLIIALLLALTTTACHQPKQITTTHHHDTIYLTHVQHDSIDRYHTSVVYLSADTIHHYDTLRLTRYRTLYRDSIRIINHTDTIIKTIETSKKPTLWQRISPHLCLLLAIALILAQIALRLTDRRKL